MLAAHDQENRLFGHSVGGVVGKSHVLGPKTPGAKGVHTPMKVPLHDGHGTVRMAGKSVLGGRPGNENMRTVGKGKSTLVTPLGEAAHLEETRRRGDDEEESDEQKC